nr:YraN family protein [Blastochloris tepida]
MPPAPPAAAVEPDPEPVAPDARQPTPERLIAHRFGLSAESVAAVLLIGKGFRILARRWRSSCGEVDIVARDRRTLIFVEVKARRHLDDAAYALDLRQRRRIAAAASLWLARRPDHAQLNVRFDVVLVAPNAMPRHIPAAFDCDG